MVLKVAMERVARSAAMAAREGLPAGSEAVAARREVVVMVVVALQEGATKAAMVEAVRAAAMAVAEDGAAHQSA